MLQIHKTIRIGIFKIKRHGDIKKTDKIFI